MIYLQIKNDIKQAMIDKNTDKRDLLRNVINKAQMIIKAEDPHSTFDKINDDVMITAIRKELKELQQTSDSIPETKDEHLLSIKADTLLKIGILENYLPRQLSADEIKTIILSIVDLEQKPNKGSIMKQIMPVLKGQADGKVISSVVDELLNN